jgi:hypothetical protein
MYLCDSLNGQFDLGQTLNELARCSILAKIWLVWNAALQVCILRLLPHIRVGIGEQRVHAALLHGSGLRTKSQMIEASRFHICKAF